MNYMFYTKRLVDLREEKNTKQIELSKILKLGNVVYGHYERGKTIIPIKHLNTLCNYFHVSLDYLFEFSNVRNYNKNDNINIPKFANRLKDLRISKKLSKKEFAFSTNLNQAIISKYENQKKFISTKNLYCLCQKYNISADYLLGKIDHPKHLK